MMICFLCVGSISGCRFACGLITVNDQIRQLPNPALQRYLPNELLESEFVRREGLPLIDPDRFAPEPNFMAPHRMAIFQRK